MTCTSPITGYRTKTGQVKFSPAGAYADRTVTIPCGRCMACRLGRASEWSTRIANEAQFHQDNSFLTLTYAPENLPEGGTLVKKHFQDFMKRLRKEIYPTKIRYYACGEYGSQLSRPHYHAIIFGYDFTDKELLKENKHGHKLYKSESLARIWGKGHCWIGAVTEQSANYVARYVTKKIYGDEADNHYVNQDYVTGEVFALEPEFTLMSKKPGIGYQYAMTYKDDLRPSDFLVINGRRKKVPRYYDKIFHKEEQADRLGFLTDTERVKNQRRTKAMRYKDDNTPQRLEVKRKITLSRAKMLKRDYEGQ